MSSYRQHAHLDVPLESAWDLVATPTLYPSWWPRIIEVEGQEFEQGDEFVQVTRDPIGHVHRTDMLIESRDEFRELRMSCRQTGSFAHWTLTAAQNGTFVELELGLEAKTLWHRLGDAALGRRYFRRWSEESLAALRDAARDRVT